MNELIGITERMSGRYEQTTIEATVDKYFSALSELDYKILRKKPILIAGCGDAGGNIAVELARRQIGAESEFILYDEDLVDLSNIQSGQPYTIQDIDEQKAKALKNRLQQIIPQASISALGYYKNNDIPLNCIAVDGIDIAAPQDVLAFHTKAMQSKVPTFVGIDIMEAFTLAKYDYAVNQMYPLNGRLTQEMIDTYNAIPADALDKRKLASYALLTKSGLIEPTDIPFSQVLEFINPTVAEGKSKQEPITARAMGAFASMEIAKQILADSTKAYKKMRINLETEKHGRLSMTLRDTLALATSHVIFKYLDSLI